MIMMIIPTIVFGIACYKAGKWNEAQRWESKELTDRLNAESAALFQKASK